MSAHNSNRYGSNQSTAPPETIPSDMKGVHLGMGSGKLETGSCAMAERFWLSHWHDMINIKDRKELGRFFAQIQDKLLEDDTPFPASHPLGIGDKTLRDVCVHELSPNGRRHFRQVLFSLSVHGNVCTVIGQGSAITWTGWASQQADIAHPAPPAPP